MKTLTKSAALKKQESQRSGLGSNGISNVKFFRRSIQKKSMDIFKQDYLK
jgi:hypothetical protein